MSVGRNNVLVGIGANSEFNNCVVIGPGHSTADSQLVIGNEVVSVSRVMTPEEFAFIRDTLIAIAGGLR